MTDEAREEGFYWVVLGQNRPEVAYWERGEWWLAGDARPWHPDAVTVVSDRMVFRPHRVPAAWLGDNGEPIAARSARIIDAGKWP